MKQQLTGGSSLDELVPVSPSADTKFVIVSVQILSSVLGFFSPVLDEPPPHIPQQQPGQLGERRAVENWLWGLPGTGLGALSVVG